MIRFKPSVKSSKATERQAILALQKLLARKDLGFHQLPLRDENWDASEKLASELLTRGDELIVMGMGGSSMGGRCLASIAGSTSSAGNDASIKFLSDTDPLALERVLGDRARLRQAQFLLISKSGNTLEVGCMLDILQNRLKDLGRNVKEAAAVISEPKDNPLWSWAEKNDVLRAAHPVDVGGRFSALSPTGLVPAAYARVNLADVRAGAKAALENHKLIESVAAFYYDSFKRREHLSVFWFYLEALNPFGPWLEQLWAESLGKKMKSKRAASMPLVLSGTGAQHSVLQQLMEDALTRSVCFVRSSDYEAMGPQLSGEGLDGFEYLAGQNLGYVYSVQSQSTEEALRKAKRTTASLDVGRLDARTLGELIMTFELIVGTLGGMLGINAFDQPGVEVGKKITKAQLARDGAGEGKRVRRQTTEIKRQGKREARAKTSQSARP